jgi:hypothetical protein
MSEERVPGWDDARLDAAFASFAASAPAPAGLAASTVQRLRTSGSGRPGRLGRASLTALGGLAVAAVVVLALAAWPRPSSPPVGQAVALADLPVIEVSGLLERMTDPTPEEVVVHGWYAEAPVAVDCEVVEDPHPLIPDCEEWYRFLMVEPQALGGVRGGPIEPTVPFVIPMLRQDAHVEVPTGSDQPIEVLAVGHIADHRSGTCPAADPVECAKRFVIDRLAPAGADLTTLPEPWVSGRGPEQEPEAVVAALTEVVGPISIVSIGTITATDLESIEPIAGDGPAASLPGWVVRALVGTVPVARTFVLPDGDVAHAPVFEMTADGVTTLRDAPAPIEFEDAILGLPVIDVPAAIERRDAGEDSTELAVRGWFPPTLPASCPAPMPGEDPTILEPECVNEPWSVVTAEPEVLILRSGSSIRSRVPTSPAIAITLDGLDRSWQPDGDEPIEVVMIGHFDDDRSTFCPADVLQACRDRFVVDRVVRADGRELPASESVDIPGRQSSVEDVVDLVEAAVGDRPILSVTGVPTDAVMTTEPAIRPDVDALIQLQSAGYWIVRVLEDDLAVRYLVPDGKNAVYRIGRDDLTLVSDALPSQAAPSSPSGATVQPIGDVPGGWEVTIPGAVSTRRITVIDRSGSLRRVRLPTEAEGRSLPIDGTGMTSSAIDGTTTLVGWGGTLCEPMLGLEVTRPGGNTSLTLTGDSESLCRSALVRTHLVLEWAEAPGDIRMSDARGPAAFPDEVAGLAVREVGSAIETRGIDRDDREMAVKGWFTLDARSDCGAADVGPLLDPGCRSPARAGTLYREDREGIRFVTPNPDDLVEAADGAPVVLVGHFDDPRAAVCGDEAACRDVFVVDGLWIDGRLTEGSWSWVEDGSEPPFTPDVIIRLLPGLHPDERVVSFGALRGADLAVLEPRAAATPAASSAWVWHVTRLDEGRIRTYVVTESQAQKSIESGERRYYQEMADGTFVELESVLIVD